MPIWALLGLAGVGGYLLLSQSSSPSASSTLPPTGYGGPPNPTPSPTALEQEQAAAANRGFATGAEGTQAISPDILSYPTQAAAQAANPGRSIVQATDGSGMWGVDGVFNAVPSQNWTAAGYVVGSGYWTPKLLADLAQLRASLPPGWTVDPWHNRLVFHGPFGESHYAVTWNEARRYAHHIQTEGKTRFVDPMSGAAY